MNRKHVIGLFLLIFVMLMSWTTSCASWQGPKKVPKTIALDDPLWQLTWSDEFQGEGDADPLKWEQQEYNRRPNPHGPDGWWDSSLVALDGQGHLVISVDEVANRNPQEDDDPVDYAVGMVRSKGLFSQTYGKYEIRCKLPEESGWWVAFWLFPDKGTEPNGGSYGTGRDGTEIDIFEGWGWTDQVQMALHYDGYEEMHHSDYYKTRIPGIDQGFHEFSLVWTPDIYVFYVDGEEIWRSDFGGGCQVPCYVKITGELLTEEWALSPEWANTIESGSYPDEFLVDWVRVYTHEELSY